MSLFGEVGILNKILAAIPNLVNSVLIRGQRQRWRDDFSGNSLSSDWEITQVGSGQAIAVSGSELTITAGTAVASTNLRYKKSFSIPCKVSFLFKASQRLSNQALILEITDAAGNNYARFSVDGTTNTVVSWATANDGQSVSGLSMNLGINSSNYGTLEIDASIDEIKFSTKDVNGTTGRYSTISRNQRIPNPSNDFYVQVKAVNSAVVASSTTFYLDAITLQENEVFTAELGTIRNNKNSADAINVTQGTNPWFVTVSNNIGLFNSQVYTTETTTPLIANASIATAGKDTTGRGIFIVVVQTDQPGSLYLDQSPDSTTWLDFGVRAVAAGISSFTVNPSLRYIRFRYINGATAQGLFKVYSQLKSI